MLVLVVVFIRKARANGISASERASMFGPFAGAMPPTPLPDWAPGATIRTPTNPVRTFRSADW
jgi:hypothetical protein